MAQALTLQLPMPIQTVGIIGQEEPLTEAQQAALMVEKLQAQHAAEIQAMQHQLAMQSQQIASAIQAMQAATIELEQFQQALKDETHQAVADLAMQIARKVVMQEISDGNYEIDPIVTEALKQLPSRGEIVVRLAPGDLENCKMAGDIQARGTRAINFVADPNVPPAGCIIEAREGRVESAVGPALDAVEKTLKETE